MKTEEVVAHEFTLCPGITLTLFSLPSAVESYRDIPVHLLAAATDLSRERGMDRGWDLSAPADIYGAQSQAYLERTWVGSHSQP